MNSRVLTPLLASLMLAGCNMMPPLVEESEHVGAPVSPVILPSVIGQLRDLDTGEAYYAVYEPAALKPTPKTRYTPPPIAKEEAVTAVPFEMMVPPPPIEAPELKTELLPAQMPAPAVVVGQPSAFKRLVPFGFGHSRLGRQGREAMSAILEEAKTAARIHVRGYTDIIGHMPGNKRLALARAAEIRAYLVKGGIAPDLISTSYCIDCFIESNESEEGRAANRRAVVVMRPTMNSPDTLDLDHRDSCRRDATQSKPTQEKTS